MPATTSNIMRPPDYQPLHDGPSRWSLPVRALLLVCSHRLWRCGLHSTLQMAVVVFTLLVFFYLPLRLSNSDREILSWSAPEPSAPNHLRIVVFGSQDLLGSASDASHPRTTWPEHLCKQINCSSIVSMVPPVESRPGLTSNAIYASALLALSHENEKADIIANPASDNFFVIEQYPVPTETPDLETQVKEFLALPPPELAPRETLWIFTFGTWDIWNLAALERSMGEALVDASVSHLFSQIELLYRESLNPKSIAFSDFWINATEAEIVALTEPEDVEKGDERGLESFRIVIPQLVDITLTPGWQRRPLPSFPQSRGVQLRNAAYLTERWNSNVSTLLHDWKKKENAKPEGLVDDTVSLALEGRSTESPNRRDEPYDVLYAPYPWRAGVQLTLASYALDAITEEELQRSGLTDGRGRGTMPVDSSMRFLDVWTSCVDGSRDVVGVEMNRASDECEIPNNHLFYDAFTFGDRAIEELAKDTAELMWDELFAHP